MGSSAAMKKCAINFIEYYEMHKCVYLVIKYKT